MLRRLQNQNLIIADHRMLRMPDVDALKGAAGFDPHYLHLERAPQAG
jgi:hypothetical protein